MGAGARPGERRGGRVKGTKNKYLESLDAVIARMRRPPHEVLALIADNNVECPFCRGAGGWSPKSTELDENQRAVQKLISSTNPKAGTEWTQCKDCKGTGREAITAKLTSWCAAELMQYTHCKRKAIEVSGVDGGPIKSRHEIVFVTAGAKELEKADG